MSFYFAQDYDDEIKKYYKYTLGSHNAEEINTNLRVRFGDRLSELNILQKFKEFKEKLNHFKGKNESVNEYKKLYDEIVLEYNGIFDKANEIWKFNIRLIRNLEYKGKEISNKTGKNGLYNINKEILDNTVDSYIKLDKSLIIIKNKINDLIKLII